MSIKDREWKSRQRERAKANESGIIDKAFLNKYSFAPLASYPKKKTSPSSRTDAAAWEKDFSAATSTAHSDSRPPQNNHHQDCTPRDATAAIWHSNSTTAARRRRAPSTPARSLSTPPVVTAPVDRAARSASLDSPERRRIRSASTGGGRPSTGRAASSSSASKPRPSGHERRVTESEVIWKGVWD
ncbi:hypothetical protein OOU_Y34scaffold00581g24 [Pyricularia oryzae Y34]|uniref:Uncharacterized protein n=1 Tax=Pyricularia oryzae (strain Y34) TaxID=1143189 RepID=A0AA97NWU3_PYRO3|nr:hypothetical protein OOU_Y34scaffold00581g24 [Pyricularia oryzae Y34]